MQSRPGFNEIFSVDSTDPEKYIKEVVKLINEHEIDIVIPQTTRETLIYSELASLIPESCKIVIAGTFKTIQDANNKYHTSLIAASLGASKVEIVDGAHPDLLKAFITEEVRKSGACFLKMKNASGGRGVIRVIADASLSRNLLEKPGSFHVISLTACYSFLESLKDQIADFFAMPEVVGFEYSVDVFRSEKKFLAIPRKREVIRAGVSLVNQLQDQDKLINLCKLLSEQLGLEGVFGFQFLEDLQGRIYFLECNPRVQGTMHATIMSGVNIIEYGILNSLGLDFSVDEPNWTTRFYRAEGGYVEYS
jgi:carbamoyl-phosphate synthase large subunit